MTRTTPTDSTYMHRTVAARDGLREHFYADEKGLYREKHPHQGENDYSYLWPLSQVFAGTIDLLGLDSAERFDEDNIRDCRRAVEAYWNEDIEPPGYDSYVRPPLGEGDDVFYDDNLWIGLSLVRFYRMTGDEDALARAESVFEHTVNGWSDDDSLPRPGGVFWTRADDNDDRNTVTGAPGAKLAANLAELSDDQEYYLTWAERMHDWVEDSMRAPNGLYWDHVNGDGEVDKAQWTYNQGTMLGANVHLYRLTGENTYLRQAERIADAALEHFWSAGRIYRQNLAFNAIFLKNLRLLQAVNGDPTYVDAVREYVDEIWETYVDPETGLVVNHDMLYYDPDAPTPLLEQASLVRLCALLADDDPEVERLS